MFHLFNPNFIYRFLCLVWFKTNCCAIIYFSISFPLIFSTIITQTNQHILSIQPNKQSQPSSFRNYKKCKNFKPKHNFAQLLENQCFCFRFKIFYLYSLNTEFSTLLSFHLNNCSFSKLNSHLFKKSNYKLTIHYSLYISEYRMQRK